MECFIITFGRLTGKLSKHAREARKLRITESLHSKKLRCRKTRRGNARSAKYYTVYLRCILLPEAVSNNKHRAGVNAQLISSNEYRLNSDFGVDRVLYGAARGKFNKIALIISRERTCGKERDRESERKGI